MTGQLYEACVAMMLVTNSDQPGYDLASALAAVNACTDGDGMSLEELFNQLASEMTWRIEHHYHPPKGAINE